MTLLLTSQVEVDAPPDAVWAVLEDVGSWPEWARDCVSVAQVPEALGTVGTSLGFRLRLGGVPVPFEVTVCEAVPPHQVAWTSVKWTVTGTRTHLIEALPGRRSRVQDLKRFEHRVLPLRWVYPRRVITRMSERWLADLANEAARYFAA